MSYTLTDKITAENAFELLEILDDTRFEQLKLLNSEIRRYGEREICFFRVDRLSYDEKYPMREAFENVLLTLSDTSFNLVYIIDGDDNGISVYIGIIKQNGASTLSAGNFGEIIRKSFESNYNGSVLHRITNDKNALNKAIFDAAERFKHSGCIIGIPGTNEYDSADKLDFQGMDRLINTMLGSNWRLTIVCEPISRQDIHRMRSDVYSLYERLKPYSKTTVQNSANYSDSSTTGTNSSYTRGKNRGTSDSRATSNGGGNDSQTKNWNRTDTQGTQTGFSESNTVGESKSKSESRGNSASITLELENKPVAEIIKYIDEELLPRIDTGYTRGMYRTSLTYMADNTANLIKLKAGIMSLFKGEKAFFNSFVSKNLPVPNGTAADFLNCFTSRSCERGNISDDNLILKGIPFFNDVMYLSTYLTPKEVSVIAALPQKEVPGLALRESVEFGLNFASKVTADNFDKSDIALGKIVHNGRILDIPFDIGRSVLNKHIFIAGVTGSGKTTTCHKILADAEQPFLVIEPAKTEYRTLINKDINGKKVAVFTLGNENIAPFRFNPFELVEGEILSAHIDTMKAAFTTAFPMEGSMPQLLEEAIVKCYEKKGWCVELNENIEFSKEVIFPNDCDASHSDCDAFPIMSDLLRCMEDVVKEKKFGDRLQSEYLGSLVSRLSNLTVGTKGSMFNCSRSVSIDYILKNNVVIEMDDLKSAEDKSLVMGFLLMRLCAAVKHAHKNNVDFKHITLVEEAHRLLSRPDFSDGGAKKAAVETFTDMLAEVRKYGEGLVIVDQIPNKLAPEVLKNTNTKIIHKIFARDDKDAVGDTMLMGDKQKDYLSALLVGHAIVFSENTEKPVHVSVDAISNTNEAEITDEVVAQRFREIKDELGIGYNDDDTNKLYPIFVRVANDIINKEEGEESKALNFFLKKVKLHSEEKQIKQIVEKLCKQYYERIGKISSSSTNTELYIECLNGAVDTFLKCCNCHRIVSTDTGNRRKFF